MNGPRRFVVTSVVRRAGQAHASGFVRVVDRADGCVLYEAPIPESIHRAKDPNPRGGLRGARGVSVCGDRLVIANTERLLIYDPDWRLIRDVTHPWMGGVHDILAEEEGIWVTCTTADLLLKVGWDGTLLDVWEWRKDAALVDALGLGAVPPVDRSLDYRDPEATRDGVRNLVHLNAVTRGADGLLLSFGRIFSRTTFRKERLKAAVGAVAKTLGVRKRKASPRAPAGTPVPVNVSAIEGSASALVRLDDAQAPLTASILRHVPNTRVPNHNIVQVGDLLVMNDSNASELVAWPVEGGEARHRVRVPGDPAFVRGLAHLDGLRFLTGSQMPTAVHEVDLEGERVTRTYPLDGAPAESVYDVALLPDSFSMPDKFHH